MAKKHLIIFFIFIFSIYPTFPALIEGTLVKTPAGLTPIEQLVIGDIVLSYQNGNQIENRITHIASTKICPFYKVSTGKTFFYTSANQRVYDPHVQDWIAIESLNAESQLYSLTSGIQTCSTIIIDTQAFNGYDLSLEEPHNFLITEQGILVHNIAPVIAVFLPVIIDTAIIAKGATCAVALLSAHFLHKRLAKQQSKHLHSHPTPNSSPPLDPEDPEWKKMHPHGRYEDARYHHQNSRGRKSPAPKNGQGALDNSVQISNDSTRRIGVSEGEYVVLSEHGENLFHGHTRPWNELDEAMKRVLNKAKLVNLKGKIL